MSERAYKKGVDFPVLHKDVLRLYSMRLCPYAQRTRLVLLYKNIPHEIINCNLKRKPNWLWNRNPKGLVPVLEKNGVIVYESRDCNDYLEQQYPAKSLTPPDATTRERHVQLMDLFDNDYIPRFYGLLRSNENEKVVKLNHMLDFLDIFEKELKGNYFGGDQPVMLDFTVWPWLERLSAVTDQAGFELLPKERFPRLGTYIKTMYELPAVKKTMLSGELHAAFSQSLAAGNPNYDIGLSKL